MKKGSKFVALSVMFIMVFTMVMPVSAKFDPEVLVDGEPVVVGDMIANDPFDVKDAARVESTVYGPNYAGVSGGGKLFIQKYNYSSPNIAFVKYHFNADKQNITNGIACVEFDVERKPKDNLAANNGLIQMKIRNAANLDFFSGTWESGGLRVFTRAYKEATPSQSIFIPLTGMTGNIYRFKFLFDLDNSKFTMYIDNQLAIDDAYSRIDLNSISMFYFYIENVNYNRIEFDNLKVFRSLYRKTDVLDTCFQNAQNVEQQNLVSGETIRFAANLKNNLTTDQTVVPIIALYDAATNKMEAIQFGERIITAGATTEVTSEAISLEGDLTNKYVKGFIWYDGCMVPVGTEQRLDYTPPAE